MAGSLANSSVQSWQNQATTSKKGPAPLTQASPLRNKGAAGASRASLHVSQMDQGSLLENEDGKTNDLEPSATQVLQYRNSLGEPSDQARGDACLQVQQQSSSAVRKKKSM